MAIEALICETCNQTFKREKVRGRKPKNCPSCKETGVTKPKAIQVPASPKEVKMLQEYPVNYEETRKLTAPDTAIPRGEGEATERHTYYYEIALGDKVINRGDEIKSLFHNSVMKFDAYVESKKGDKYIRLLGIKGYQNMKYYSAAPNKVTLPGRRRKK